MQNIFLALIFIFCSFVQDSNGTVCYKCSSDTDIACGNQITVLASDTVTCNALQLSCQINIRKVGGKEVISRGCGTGNKMICEAEVAAKSLASNWVSGSCCDYADRCNNARSLKPASTIMSLILFIFVYLRFF
ncbi:uncharacterized protein LOC141904221 [Tubulanus polymorphus]|uniref:uncharacterized protein LOC141904221 n=1 Tax=Tubulanus polymorphus TaxID=672921 RepID=UPI003DA67B12